MKILALILLLIASPCLAVSVPITVSEALPLGVTGTGRTAAPVTVGIPLADSDGISSVTQLGLSGASAGQFRPLTWWPSGNIKWVLIDFQTDLASGASHSSVFLVGGSGNFGGSSLATDGTTVSIDTGAAVFTIKKSGFNVFDTVQVGGQTLVATGNAGAVKAVGSDDTLYSSVNDTPQVSIEENGPLRAVVKVAGTLKSAASARLMDYTLRLHFFKGKSQVKAVMSLRNATYASGTANSDVVFKSAEVVVPLSIGSTKNVTLALQSTSDTRQLSGTAVLQQGANSAYTYPSKDETTVWTPPVPRLGDGTTDPAYYGMKAQVGATVINAFGTASDTTRGYAALYDSTNKGVAVAMRDMKGYWPASFELKDTGEVSVEMYGKWNVSTVTIPWGKYTTREWLWNFNTTGKDPQGVMYDIQYPVTGRAALSQYAATKAIYGQGELVTAQQQTQAITSSSTWPTTSPALPPLTNFAVDTFYRAFKFSQGAGFNQIDQTLSDLYDYLRTGNGGFWLRGTQRAQFISDAAFQRSDDFSTALVDRSPQTPALGLNGLFMDMEHAHVMSVPVFYFLTGNEGVKDAFLDYCEFLWRTQQENNWYTIPSTPYFRAFLRRFRNMALAHEFTTMTHSPIAGMEFKSDVETTMNFMLDSRDTSAPYTAMTTGRSLTRGYYFVAETPTVTYDINTFWHAQLGFETVWQIRRIMQDTNWGYTRQLDIDDFLTGWAHFFYDEALFTRVDDPWSYKYQYLYNLYNAVTLPTLAQFGAFPPYRPYISGRPAYWLYQCTGDVSYLTKAMFLDWEAAKESNTDRAPSELQEQALMSAYLAPSSVARWVTLPVTVTPGQSGSYTVSWTVPQGATKYRIKYSGKNIVDWLGFDKVSRAYQYDPSQYTAFFAASNIANNPTPQAEGTTQSITLTGLPDAQTFSAKYYTGTVAAPVSTHRSLIGRIVGKMQ